MVLSKTPYFESSSIRPVFFSGAIGLVFTLGNRLALATQLIGPDVTVILRESLLCRVALFLWQTIDYRLRRVADRRHGNLGRGYFPGLLLERRPALANFFWSAADGLPGLNGGSGRTAGPWAWAGSA